MATFISNGSLTVEQSDKFDPRKLRVTFHATSRKTEFRARYNAAKPDDEHGEHLAYIDVGVTVGETPYETPENERRDDYTPPSAELVGFLSVEQARALHKALGEALACSARPAAIDLTAEEYRNEVAGAKQVECGRPGGGAPSECFGDCGGCEWRPAPMEG